MSAAASGRRLNFRHAAERTRVLFLSVRQTPDLTASAQPGIAGEIPRQACKIACAGRAVATLLGSEPVGTKLAMIISAFAGRRACAAKDFCHQPVTGASPLPRRE
jgi:hypothetical protein